MKAISVPVILCLLLLSRPSFAADGEPPQGTRLPIEDKRDQILYSEETENPKVLFKKFSLNVLRDQEQIWSSPFRMNRRNAKWWILFGGVTAALIATDHKVSNDLLNHGRLVSISSDISQVGATYTVLPAIGGLYLAGVLADNSKARETALLGGEAALDGLIEVEVLKLATRRSRPLDHEGQFFDGGSSFPSGHAVAVWSMASVVAAEYNRHKIVPILAYSIAGLVSASRITARRHFPSDVVVGSALGWFTGRYVFETHYDHSVHRRNGFTHALLHPQVGPATVPDALGVGLNWGN